jgi:sigma-B regulation protein RsbU (phosphoserine phosphatase)
VVVGDTAGPDLTAAVCTSFLRAIAGSSREGRERSLADLATRLHERLYELCPEGSYATMFAARYDSARGLLHYVNAGYESPLLLRKSTRGYGTAALAPTGPVIGMLRRAIFQERAVSLAPEDLLAVYTDGLCETTNREGEPWGLPRLTESLKAASARKARDIVEHVLEAAANFADGCGQHDDRTLWVCRVEEMHDAIFTLSDSVPMLAVA